MCPVHRAFRLGAATMLTSLVPEGGASAPPVICCFHDTLHSRNTTGGPTGENALHGSFSITSFLPRTKRAVSDAAPRSLP